LISGILELLPGLNRRSNNNADDADDAETQISQMESEQQKMALFLLRPSANLRHLRSAVVRCKSD